jgi:hypothetical protein
MIEATIGRPVLIRRKEAHSVQPEAGFIAFVHNDELVNVAGFNANGAPFSMTSLPLVQGDLPELGDCAYLSADQKVAAPPPAPAPLPETEPVLAAPPPFVPPAPLATYPPVPPATPVPEAANVA